jgi:hypothetical protein
MKNKNIIISLIKQLDANIELFEALRIRVAREGETFEAIEKQIYLTAFGIKNAKDFMLKLNLLNKKAIFVKEIQIPDPDDSSSIQTLNIFKHPSGALLGIDATFLDQCFDEDEKIEIPDPYSNGDNIEIIL